jgi:hypothetical protein
MGVLQGQQQLQTCTVRGMAAGSSVGVVLLAALVAVAMLAAAAMRDCSRVEVCWWMLPCFSSCLCTLRGIWLRLVAP